MKKLLATLFFIACFFEVNKKKPMLIIEYGINDVVDRTTDATYFKAIEKQIIEKGWPVTSINP